MEEKTVEEFEQCLNQFMPLNKRMRQINESKAAVGGFKQRPGQTELKSLLYLLEDIVTVYENYLAVNLTQSGTITKILENTIKGICNYIANDFE